MVRYRFYLNGGRENVIVSFDDDETAIQSIRDLMQSKSTIWGFNVEGKFVGFDSSKLSAIVPETSLPENPRTWAYSPNLR